jgi:hypothetical protein
LETGLDAAETLKPTEQGVFVVALPTKRVGAGNAMMDPRRDCSQRFIPAMVVDVVEGLLDSFFNNVAVEHQRFSM